MDESRHVISVRNVQVERVTSLIQTSHVTYGKVTSRHQYSPRTFEYDGVMSLIRVSQFT